MEETPNITTPQAKPITPQATTGSSTGSSTEPSMKDRQKQVPERVNSQGQKTEGARLAQEERPRAEDAQPQGPVKGFVKGKAKKWAMGAAFGGSIGAGGIISYFLS